jgi:large subunit ribosomal protein L27
VNVGRGRDDSLYACIPGVVQFEDKGRMGKYINIVPLDKAQAN